MPPSATTSKGANDAANRSREMAARLYTEKINEYAKALAERLGPVYGTKEVNWPQIIELWETRDPDVDVDKAWDDAAKQAAMLIEKDPSVDQEKVNAEIPVEVARRVFPKREEAIKALGGTGYQDWAKNATEIEKRASAQRVPPPPPGWGEDPAVTPDTVATDQPALDPSLVSGPAPVPEDPSALPALDPMAPAGPTGESPSQLPGVGAATPLMNRAPGAL